MANVASDKFFWLAYSKAIQQAIGPLPGKDSAIFIATKTQKGPLASPLIPAEYTNYGIYKIGDNLLSANNLFYVPSSQNSYIKSLRTYLSYVDLGGNNSEDVLTRVVLASQDLQSALVKAEREEDAADAQFTKKAERGLTGNQTFAQWAPTGAAGYANALKEVAAAAAAHKTAIADLKGPLADQYNLDSDRITQALTSLVEVPGIAIGATSATPASAREVLNLSNEGKPIPPPKGTRYVPEYSSPDYVNTVRNWINTPSHGKPGKNSTQIKISQGESVSETDFGQVSVNGNLGFSYFPWVSFGTSASSEQEELLSNSELTDNDVEVSLTYDEIRAVNIFPGEWNIGNPKATYPKLRPDAPPSAKVLVAPTQFILVKNLGYRVKFHNAIKSTFDKKVKDSKKAGSFVRIFGIPIQVGGDYKKSTEQTSHVASWDEASGEFVVASTDDGAFATVVAVVGDKIYTA